MKNLYTLGLSTCAIFSVFLTGVSFNLNHTDHSERAAATDGAKAYVVNNSHSVVYFKPESKRANPDLMPDEAYAIAPGESLYAPFDAIVAPATEAGKVYRIPTGGKVIVNEDGIPEPANIIAKGGLMLPAYGTVEPPYESFAKLANSKQVLYNLPDVVKSSSDF